jgi:hypothetical protein
MARRPDVGVSYDSAMPFKSQAQRRKFAELLVKGEISPETFEEWNRETGGKKLPERVRPKAKTARKTARKTTRKKTKSRARKKTASARKRR